MHTHVHDFASAQHFADGFALPHSAIPSGDQLLAFIKQVWTDIRDYTIALCQALTKDVEDLFAFDRAMRHGASAVDICGLWLKAKPIVTLIANFPFFPSSWKTPVQTLITLLNTLCPAQ